MNRRALRRQFFRSLGSELGVVWPVLSGLIVVVLVLGIVVGMLEGWTLGESLYFACVTGLTIGYGDYVPHGALARVLSATIGATGIVITALLAAVAVRSLPDAPSEGERRER